MPDHPIEHRYSISELASEFDITPRAIRFYEKHGFRIVNAKPRPSRKYRRQ